MLALGLSRPASWPAPVTYNYWPTGRPGGGARANRSQLTWPARRHFARAPHKTRPAPSSCTNLSIFILAAQVAASSSAVCVCVNNHYPARGQLRPEAPPLIGLPASPPLTWRPSCASRAH